MSKMFSEITATWNPVKGCLHGCSYCWARKLAEGKLKKTAKYHDGFKPAFFPDELKKVPKRGFVFVCSMGDLFGEWVSSGRIRKVIEATYNSNAQFLFMTKNPRRYIEFFDMFDENKHVLGTTIETDGINEGTDKAYRRISFAPLPYIRQRIFRKLNYPRKVISVEPIVDFTSEFCDFIQAMRPTLVYVGYDNYNNHLPEPPLEKTLELIKSLHEAGIEVREKTLREAWNVRYHIKGVAEEHPVQEAFNKFMHEEKTLRKEGME